MGIDPNKAKALLASHFAEFGDITDNSAFEAYVNTHSSAYTGAEQNPYVRAAIELNLVEENANAGSKEEATMSNATQPTATSGSVISSKVNETQSQRAANAAATSITRIYADKRSAKDLTANIKTGHIQVNKEKRPMFEVQREKLTQGGWTLCEKPVEVNGVTIDSTANMNTAKKAAADGTELPVTGGSDSVSIVGVDLKNNSGLKTALNCLSVKSDSGLKAFLGLYTNGTIEPANKDALGVALKRVAKKSTTGNQNVPGAPEYKIIVAFKNKKAATKSTPIEYTREDAADTSLKQKVTVNSNLSLVYQKPSTTNPGSTLTKVVPIKLTVEVPKQVRKQQYVDAFGSTSTGFNAKQLNSAHDAVSDILASLASDSNFAATTKLTESDIEALRNISAASAGAAWSMQ